MDDPRCSSTGSPPCERPVQDESASHSPNVRGSAGEGGLDRLPQRMIEDLGTDGIPDDGEVAHVQTHISHLFLTRDRVYKIRKAVRFPFLSFGTRAERNADCLREVALNRRLSPDVYLGIAPIESVEGRFRVGKTREQIESGASGLEHCVVMRRLREGRDTQSLLERGELEPRHVEAVARRVAAFHASNSLGRPAPWSPAGWLSVIEVPILETLDLIGQHARDDLQRERAARLRAGFETRLDACADAIERRRREGRAVDGHGDLQLAHVWFDGSDTDPSIIDCTEFSEDFRRIDAASEVAFYAMDLAYRGASRLAAQFLAEYAAAGDDFDLYSVVDLFVAYRSAVRAKVASLAATDVDIRAEQRTAARGSADRHLALAESSLADRAPGFLVLTCGTVGSGKSTVARALAAAVQGAIISSDRTRKRLAGLDASDHRHTGAAPDVGLYSVERTAEVYAALLERAEPVIASGRVAVLDASYAARRHRDVAREWARRAGIHCVLLEVRCGESEARRRLAERERDGQDVSDAGPAFLKTSLARFEAPLEWPDADRELIESDASNWRDVVREISARRTAKSPVALASSTT